MSLPSPPPAPPKRVRRLTGRHLVWIGLSIVVLGQATALAFRTSQLWPFTQVKPYAWFPSDFEAESLQFALTVGDERLDLPTLSGVNYRLIRRFEQAYVSAQANPGKNPRASEVLSALLQYAQSRAPAGVRYHGVAVYRLRWDLSAGVYQAEQIDGYTRRD